MRIALNLAKKRKGLTHPNPTVGAVIVKDGKIIGKGYHKKAGLPHGEREAIADAKSRGYDLRGSTMYVTLEPCCHYGRTPPCTLAIVEEGISRVVVSTLDPNPMVAGKGVEFLRQRGIRVDVGVLQEEGRRLNEDFFTYITEKRPFIHLKLAQTLDGKIATKTGSSKWITSEESRKLVHKLRNEATAVLVGKNTALRDNPFLTVRGIRTERQPIRVIIDKDLQVPLHYNVYNPDTKVIVITSEDTKTDSLEKFKHLKPVKLPLNSEWRFDLKDILQVLFREEIVHLFVEGGKDVFTQFIREGIFDKISLFIAPKLIGEDGIDTVGPLGVEDISEVRSFDIRKIRKVGRDLLLQIYNTNKSNGQLYSLY